VLIKSKSFYWRGKMKNISIILAAIFMATCFLSPVFCNAEAPKTSQKTPLNRTQTSSQSGQEIVCPDGMDVSVTIKAMAIPAGGWQGTANGNTFHLQADSSYIYNNMMICSYAGVVGYSINQPVPSGKQCVAMQRTTKKELYFLCK
jgi:hypothetical protein